MGIRERRERERTATRQTIIDAAQRLAAQKGWAALTVREVAAKAEYSPALIYEYFSNKEEILAELMRAGFHRLHLGLSQAIEGEHQPESAVRAIGQAYWSFALENPALYQIMHGLGGVPFGTSETPIEARSCFNDFLKPISALVLERGGSSVTETEDQVVLYWAFLHGLVSLNMNTRIRGGTTRATQLAQRLIRDFIRGCVPEEEEEHSHS